MRRSYWIGALMVVLGGFAGFQHYSSWSLNQPQNKSGGRSEGVSASPSGERNQARGSGRSHEAVPVLVATAQRKAIPIQIRAVGNGEPFATVSVKSQVTGVLMQAHFKEGQNVKKGQMLFTIDPRPFEASVKQTEANLARDVAQLQNARAQARRYAELLKKQYVSQEQYDQISTNADALESVVEADKAAVENAKVQLSYCYIYAPIDGQVGSLLVNEGNLVRVNDGAPLVVINQLSPINVTFSVPEQHLANIKRHMATGALKVDARFPSDEGHPEQGNLAFVDNAVDRITGTIKLKAEFKNSARRLWPGQFINVAVTLSTQADAVVIPSEAIQVGPNGQQVFVVKEDRRVEVRLITVGQTQDGEAVITKGLAAGELVVREGQFLLGPGSQVDIKDANKTAETIERSKHPGARGKRKAQEQGAS